MNTETLLREFIAALIELERVRHEGGDEDCDFICADDIESYWVREKRIELQNKLLSLPL